MARGLNPAQAAEKWANNLGASVNNIRDGVARVTESPMEKAANASQRYIDGVTRAVQTGWYQSQLRAVTLEAWK